MEKKDNNCLILDLEPIEMAKTGEIVDILHRWYKTTNKYAYAMQVVEEDYKDILKETRKILQQWGRLS